MLSAKVAPDWHLAGVVDVCFSLPNKSTLTIAANVLANTHCRPCLPPQATMEGVMAECTKLSAADKPAQGGTAALESGLLES